MTFPAIRLIIMLALLPVASGAVAQSISGFYLGEDKGGLQRLGNPVRTKSDGSFTTQSYLGSDGIELKATFENQSNQIVALETTWPRASIGPLAGYGGLTFGKTSLGEIRSQLGSKGILYASQPPVVVLGDSIAVLSYFEVSGTDAVAAFFTSISGSDAALLKASFGVNAYKNSPEAAKLRTIGVFKRDYLERGQGTKRILDIGYREIPWSPPLMAPKQAAISLARIKPGQLPVFRQYSGPKNFPDFTGRDKEFSNFRTRITEGMGADPSFAGEYAVIQIGCGTGCSIAYLGNSRTGQVFKVPVGGENNMYLSLQYQLDSRLLVSQWANHDADKCFVQFFDFDDGEWTELLKHEVGPTDDCFKTIAENLR
ncbi:hypothetical protein ABUK73_06530 [Agrobacterium sp. BA1120]|uniref:hypothetical protein n=1 Tax=Agrobacterium sp. BA1120 TaxID=3228927 RepID=UPI00336A2831